MIRHLSIWSLLVFSVGRAGQAYACTCQVMEASQAIESEKLAMAFAGRVTKLVESSLKERRVVEVEFEISQSFKGGEVYLGKLAKSINIIMPFEGQNCRVERFRVGDAFTVFAEEKAGFERLYTDLCWGSRVIGADGTSTDLEFLMSRFPAKIEADPVPDMSTSKPELPPVESESTENGLDSPNP
ncbi:MAG: hypothetical protein COV44_09790 [Deltaproteobacteria bacterium CG11_big_fil_rev_8_21_14_0_20_45_16]|nr:MAG: hypothetical protein COV44_09790 [Deltaproteobacteria bacterium CG11_big_fil_rev_8_21_14_0_20_45_16]